MSCDKLRWNTITEREAVTLRLVFVVEQILVTLHLVTLLNKLSHTSLIAARCSCLIALVGQNSFCVNPCYNILGSHRVQFLNNFVVIFMCFPFPPY